MPRIRGLIDARHLYLIWSENQIRRYAGMADSEPICLSPRRLRKYNDENQRISLRPENSWQVPDNSALY